MVAPGGAPSAGGRHRRRRASAPLRCALHPGDPRYGSPARRTSSTVKAHTDTTTTRTPDAMSSARAALGCAAASNSPSAGTLKGTNQSKRGRLYGGSTALDPACEAVAARAPVVGRHVDYLRRRPSTTSASMLVPLSGPSLSVAVIVGRISATGVAVRSRASRDRPVAWEGFSNSGTAHPLPEAGRDRCLVASVLLDETLIPLADR